MPNPTVEEASAHLFLSVGRLRQFQREGVLPRSNSNDWSLDGIRRRYIENLRAIKGNHLQKVAPRAKRGEVVLNLEAERARLSKEQADGQELKNAALRGELIPAAEVVDGWQAAIGRARSLLLGIPSASADDLVILAIKGPAVVRERLAVLIHDALSELADTRVDEVDDDEAEEAA